MNNGIKLPWERIFIFDLNKMNLMMLEVSWKYLGTADDDGSKSAVDQFVRCQRSGKFFQWMKWSCSANNTHAHWFDDFMTSKASKDLQFAGSSDDFQNTILNLANFPKFWFSFQNFHFIKNISHFICTQLLVSPLNLRLLCTPWTAGPFLCDLPQILPNLVTANWASHDWIHGKSWI